MDKVNQIFMKLSVALMNNNSTQFKSNKINNIIDPLQTIIQLALLSECPIYSKLSIRKNIVYIQQPSVSQGVVRWYREDTKRDLLFMFNCCKHFSHFYKSILTKIEYKNEDNESTNLYLILKQMSIQGIHNLMKTYSKNVNDNYTNEVLKLYLYMLEHEKKIDIQTKEINGIFKNIVQLYNNDELHALLYMLLLLQKTKNLNIIESINILFKKKNEKITEWIHTKLII